MLDSRMSVAAAWAALILSVALTALYWGATGELGITNFDSLALASGTNNVALDVRQNHATANIATFKDGSSTDLTIGQDATTFANAHVLDLNGSKLDLDADADTSVTADTDDQIDVEVSGADDFRFTANTFTALSGSTVAADTIAETTAGSGVTIDGLLIKDTGIPLGTEAVGTLPTIATATITYTTKTGLFTIADGEIWIIHGLLVNVTADYDCTGDDCVASFGDGNDADGLLALVDAELQAADTEVAGGAAGWQGYLSGTRGAYLADGGGFVYAPSGAAETIDYTAGGTTPAGGAATVYLIYTRIQ